MLIDFERLTVKEAKVEYPYLWETYRHEFSHLSDEQIATIISITTGFAPIVGSVPENAPVGMMRKWIKTTALFA